MTAFLKKSLLFIYSSHFNRAFYIFKTPPKFFKLEKQKNTKKKVGVVSSSPEQTTFSRFVCHAHVCVAACVRRHVLCV